MVINRNNRPANDVGSGRLNNFQTAASEGESGLKRSIRLWGADVVSRAVAYWHSLTLMKCCSQSSWVGEKAFNVFLCCCNKKVLKGSHILRIWKINFLRLRKKYSGVLHLNQQ